MTAPIIKKEIKKPTIKQECYAKGKDAQERNARPPFKAIFERRLKEHALTWQELAKR
jgi:hypothetical protein